MKKITSEEKLKERIRDLEVTCQCEREDLKLHLKLLRESLKPSHFLSSAAKDLISSQGSSKILNVLLGVAAGYLTKKLVFGSTHNPLKRMAGALLQMSVTGTVTRGGDGLQKIGMQLWKRLFRRKNENHESRLDDVYSQI
jgi:hypothetical protein